MTVFQIIDSPLQLVIFPVTENLHRCIEIQRDTFFNWIPADTVCAGIYVRIAVPVKHKTDRKSHIDVSARKGTDTACFLIAAVGVCQSGKRDIGQS